MVHVKIWANQIISLQISYLSEATVANFQKCVYKALFSNGEKNPVQAKQWLDKRYLDSALLETTVKK